MSEAFVDPTGVLIDATPDEDYPIRILTHYWGHTHFRYETDPPNPLYEEMNKMQDARKAILEEAMKILRETENMQRLKDAAQEY